MSPVATKNKSPGPTGAKPEPTRKGDKTRYAIVDSAFKEFHRTGFKAASLSKILAGANVSKGALYHYFTSKTELGYAVVDERLDEEYQDRFLRPLEIADDPIDCLKNLVMEEADRLIETGILYGCPLVSLGQEMSTDEGFRSRVDSSFSEFRRCIESAINRGKDKGFVRQSVDAKAAAHNYQALRQGRVGIAKSSQNPDVLFSFSAACLEYLDSLRPHDWNEK